MTGNVWQWTDEFEDEHTRAAILRGGGYYRPKIKSGIFRRLKNSMSTENIFLMAPSKDLCRER